MKKRFNVWTKEPYGSWEKANPKPLSVSDAANMEKLLSASGRELKVKVVPSTEGAPELN